jgi:1-acyl-sn-glycerol-3-phosphate acyltransferase
MIRLIGRALGGPIVLSFIFLAGVARSLFYPRDPQNVFWTSKKLAWFGQRILGIQFKVEGEEHFVDTPKIIVSNHQNNFDMFPGGRTVPPRTVTLGKRELLYIPIFGLFYWLSGNILINRRDKKQAWEVMNQVKDKLIKENKSLWILPEGTRSRGRGLLPFKRGAFVLSFDGKLPLIPVCFSSYHKFFDFTKKMSGTILIRVLPPLNPADFQSAEQMKERCYDLMKAEISRLDALRA